MTALERARAFMSEGWPNGGRRMLQVDRLATAMEAHAKEAVREALEAAAQEADACAQIAANRESASAFMDRYGWSARRMEAAGLAVTIRAMVPK